MRTLFRIFAAICMIAAPASASGPTTAPSAPVPSAPLPTVLIFPFQPIGQTTGREWVRSALQENIVAVINQTGLVQTRAMPEPVVSSDSAKAISAGKDAGAVMVIFGSYQIVGDQIRVTGEMTQVPSGNVVSSLQATGNVVDLFRVEDKLTGQLNPAMARSFAPPQKQPVVVYGLPTGTYVTSNVNVQPLQSGLIQPDYYSGPSSGYVPDYPYVYSPDSVFSSGVFLGNRLDYGDYESYNGYGHGPYHFGRSNGGGHRFRF